MPSSCNDAATSHTEVAQDDPATRHTEVVQDDPATRHTEVVRRDPPPYEPNVFNAINWWRVVDILTTHHDGWWKEKHYEECGPNQWHKCDCCHAKDPAMRHTKLACS